LYATNACPIEEGAMKRPFFPIIYVRGYAGTQSAVEDTVATPYMGFNLGSTKLRQAWTGDLQPHIFESPLVRLMKDFDYKDAYHDGQSLPQGPVDPKSVWIYRYYDVVSDELGEGNRPKIEYHARKLREFIRHVRSAVHADPSEFRVYLAAHSMGGLVCRCYLQNESIPGLDDQPNPTPEQKGVDKLFTFATPHGGIEFRGGLGWAAGVRDFFDPNNAATFGPKRMREYLSLGSDEPLNSLGGKFPKERVFCMVGTDSKDYSAARHAVGPLSDGLVMIKNACARGAPRAFVHRSHSGHYGIVNSESSYQNLRRFLFGDTRVDGVLEIEELSLPPKLKRALDDGKKIRASYHFEVVARVRGARWDLHRRLSSENSSIFREYDELQGPGARQPFLFTTMLDRRAVGVSGRRSLGFSVDLGLQVPEYEIDNSWWFDDHYDGGYIYRDKINIEVTPPKEGEVWKLRYGVDSRTPNRTSRSVDGQPDGEMVVFRIPIDSGQFDPRLRGQLVLRCRPWNRAE